MKLTICIVNYNKSKYLPDLFDSLIQQTDKDFSILFVDNCSTDSSIEVVNKYKANLPIELIYESRKGVQFARNTALSNVKTDYFTFVDADDIVAKNYVSFINGSLPVDELLMFSFKTFEDKKTIQQYLDGAQDFEIKKVKLEKRMYSFQSIEGIEMTYLWNKVFKKSICDTFDITFDESVGIGEDCFFIDKYLEHISSILVSKQVLYFYRKAEDSLMNYSSINELVINRFLSEIKRCDYLNEVLDVSSSEYLEWMTHEIWIYRNIYRLLIRANRIDYANNFLNNYLSSVKQRLKKNKVISLLRLKLFIKLIGKKRYFGIVSKKPQKNR